MFIYMFIYDIFMFILSIKYLKKNNNIQLGIRYSFKNKKFTRSFLLHINLFINLFEEFTYCI